MARKKLNKKVALITLVTFAIIIFAAIAYMFLKERDPAIFLKDAQAAIEMKDFKTAKLAYDKAYRYSKSADAKIDILFDMSDLALIEDLGDKEQEREAKDADWTRARGCWNKVVTIDTSNLEAYSNILDFFYTIAKSGSLQAWDKVNDTADKMLEIHEKNQTQPSFEVLIAKGQAALEKAKAGATTDGDATLRTARKYLALAKELQPENMDICLDLANAEIVQGRLDDVAGKINALENSLTKAMQIAQEAVDQYPDLPEAYINALLLKRHAAISNQEADIDLGPEFEALTKQFPNDAKVWNAGAGFFQLNLKTLEKSAEYSGHAIELDPTNIEYYKLASSTYYRYGMLENKPEFINNAIFLATRALDFPESQDTTGPNQQRNKGNRIIFNSMLAKYHLELAMTAQDEQEKTTAIENAEKSVYNIEQIIGVAENRMVLKWKGMLNFAKGQRDKAVVQLYNAFEQYENTDNNDADLSYTLARVYKDTPYLGARQKFLNSAIKGKIIHQGHPEAALELAEILIQQGFFSYAIQLAEGYETLFGESAKTNELIVKAYLSNNFFEEAIGRLEFFKDGSTKKDILTIELLFAQIKQFRGIQSQEGTSSDYKNKVDDNYAQIAGLIEKLIVNAPDEIDQNYVVSLANYYITAKNYDAAAKLANSYLSVDPDNIHIKVVSEKLKTENPDSLSIDQLREINYKVLDSISDPQLRAIRLSQYHRSLKEYDKAIELIEPLIDNPDYSSDVISNLFDIAILKEDFEYAAKIQERAKKDNVDSCEGNFFASKLALANKDYKKAILASQDCIKLQPVFPAAYATIANAYEQTDKQNLALENIAKAFSQNPMDASVARQRAILFYKRNEKLGKGTSDQLKTELERALSLAIRLNPTDSSLTSLFAENVYNSDPRRALAIRQAMQANSPSASNALLLGNMAVRLAKDQTTTETQQAMLDIAKESFEQALELQPDNPDVLNAYSEFLRITGNEDQAETMLEGNDAILWKSYVRSSKFDKAKELLVKLYKEDSSNIEVVKGLVLVSQRLADKSGVIEYSNALIALDDIVDNRLAQAQAYLELGMIDDAEKLIKAIKTAYSNENRVQLLEASLFIRKGQLSKAMTSIDRMITKDQTNPMALRLRAQVSNLSGNYNQTVNDLAAAKSLSDDPTILVELAKAYARADKLDQAILELKVAISEGKAPMSALTLLEKFYLDSKDNNELNKFYDQMIEKYPDNNYWKNRSAALLLTLGKLDLARETYLENWNSSNNSDISALQAYINVLFEAKDYSKVLSFSSQYIDSPIAPMIYSSMAKAKAALGDTNSAKEYFNKALDKADLNRVTITLTLNSALEALDADTVEGLVSERTIANGETLAANLTTFIFFNSQKQYNKALKYVEACIELAENEQLKRAFIANKADVLQLAYYNMPDQKYLNEAIEIYEQLLNESPNDIAMLNNLAYLLATNSTDIDKAEKYARQAYALLPGNGTILDTYAFTLLQNNKPQHALELLLQAVQLFELSDTSAPGDVYLHLGRANEMLEKPEEALAAYKIAGEANETLSDATKKEIAESIERLSK